MNAAAREATNREGGEVRAIIKRPWTAVPEHILEDRRLSLQARCLLAYMLGLARRPNWVIRLNGHVLPTMGVSVDRWRSIRKELETVGYYRRSETRGPDGRMSQEHLITDDPTASGWDSPEGSTGVDFSKGGGTGGGGAKGGAAKGGGTKGGTSNGGGANRGSATRGAANGGQSGSGTARGGKPTPLRSTTARSSSERTDNNTSQELSELGAAGAAPNPQGPSVGVNGTEAAPSGPPKGADVSPPAPPAPPAPSAKSSDPRGSRLPNDWAPDADLLAWAAETRPDVDPKLETLKFCNYWIAIPGGKGRKLDWPRTWQNWILGARATPGYAPTMPEAAPPSKTLQSLESLNDFSNTYGHPDHAGPEELPLFPAAGVG
ncbi:MAG: hypothetical protein EPN36_14330 [Rhodanobacteraceae bacterium]|nr:MAG: hypothetical protein EPN36_14330 [Rhodanobacteraceae bacterium]